VTRELAFRVTVHVGTAVLIAGWLALALAGPGLAATESGPASSSGNTTLIVAGLIGVAIAAIWLLKPTGKRRPPAEPRANETPRSAQGPPSPPESDEPGRPNS